MYTNSLQLKINPEWSVPVNSVYPCAETSDDTGGTMRGRRREFLIYFSLNFPLIFMCFYFIYFIYQGVGGEHWKGSKKFEWILKKFSAIFYWNLPTVNSSD